MNTLEVVDSVGMDRFWAGDAWLRAAKCDVSCALLHRSGSAKLNRFDKCHTGFFAGA